ncbi:MAG: diguanylate cyclase [Piscirickettsiaceae bacterium]|nr:MAG: diguanylate cyclase [Piscirickettsiaceae bacterium]
MNFISLQSIPEDILTKQYDYYLIVLSVVIAIIGSYTAFGVSERIYSSRHRFHEILWTIFGAIAMGIGIWSMHFIGSLALILPVAITYDLRLTLLSIIPAFLASSAVLWLMTHKAYSKSKLLLCGFILGGGVGAMHYTGMAAMEMNAGMSYITPIFVLSIIVAVVLATLALRIKFHATNHDAYQFLNKSQVLSAMVMGVAVSGMHFTAMKAVVYTLSLTTVTANTGLGASLLTTIVCIATILILIIALLLPLALRLKEITQTLKKNEEALTISATAFQSHDAIIVVNKEGLIIRVNEAFTNIIGYTETDVQLKPISFLQEEQLDESFQKEYWDAIKNDGKWSGEIWNRSKDGHVFLTKHTITTVKDKNDETTHYVAFFSDITKDKLAEKEVEQLAYFDHLTELPNRRLLHQRLEHELSIAKRYHRTGLLLFLDLDRFKQINDSLGHSAGDDLLVQTAIKLQSLLRDTDTAARLGGDEFVILISAQDESEAKALIKARNIAQKIINTINTPYTIDNQELFVSTSIGITLFNGQNESSELLLKRADTAMYQAKEAGRNTFCFYEQNMQESADLSLLTETCLRTALANNELSLYFQPQLSGDNKIIGAEALLRWNSPDLGMVPPNDFIPMAEETGLIMPIGQWVIDTTCEMINLLDTKNLHLPHIAVNISAKQFLQTDFVVTLIATLQRHNIEPERLMLEITESVFIKQMEPALEVMNALKMNGFYLSIDDFGTGYSSLSYLKQLPFDQLKIDQSFTQGISVHKNDIAIVKGVIIMAQGLGLNIIAEGTETDRQVAILKQFGCNQFQGYLFSKPLPTDRFIAYLTGKQP